jgi:hypothetical protein
MLFGPLISALRYAYGICSVNGGPVRRIACDQKVQRTDSAPLHLFAAGDRLIGLLFFTVYGAVGRIAMWLFVAATHDSRLTQTV